jgi:hypothetical protein
LTPIWFKRARYVPIDDDKLKKVQIAEIKLKRRNRVRVTCLHDSILALVYKGDMNTAFWISFAAQVVSAIIVLVLVFYGGRLKRPTRSYSDEADEQTSVVVVPGVKSTKDEESIFITTSVTNKLNRKLPFVYLSPSLDRDGGAQFTYSFWFKTEPGSNFDTVFYLCVETRPEQISSTSRN